MNEHIYPLTLLYDAACPVCSLEMDHLRERDHAGRLIFIDIAAPGFDASAYGVTPAELDAEIHGRCADGRWLRGLDVLRLAYAAVGLGWALRPTAAAPLRGLFDLGYRFFARHRRRISRAAAPLIGAIRNHRARATATRMQACRSGACASPAPAGKGTS